MKIQMEVLRGMRLYNTYYICKQCRDIIVELQFRDSQVRTRTEGVINVYTIINWKSYREALYSIRQIKVLSHDADLFYETIPVYTREKEKPQVDEETKTKLEAIKNRMVRTMDVVIELYVGFNDAKNEGGIDVKIPQCESLEQYIGYLKEIDFVFSQCPFLQHKEGRIKFEGVDVGSQWLSFVIAITSGTAAVTYILKNLGLLIDNAIRIKSHLISLEQQKEILRSQKLKNDVLEPTVEAFNFLEKHYYDEAVKALEEKNEDTQLQDGEERGKVEISLKKLVTLMDKGVEFYSSINTDKDIQALFPALEDKAELPDSILKYIEDKQKPENK